MKYEQSNTKGAIAPLLKTIPRDIDTMRWDIYNFSKDHFFLSTPGLLIFTPCFASPVAAEWTTIHQDEFPHPILYPFLDNKLLSILLFQKGFY